MASSFVYPGLEKAVSLRIFPDSGAEFWLSNHSRNGKVSYRLIVHHRRRGSDGAAGQRPEFRQAT